MSSEVLISVIGAVSALAGAAIGAAGAVLAGRFQAQAVRYQTEAQRWAQHDHWLREGLRERYIDVANAIAPAMEKCLEAQRCFIENQRNEARNVLLSIDATALMRHKAAIKAEAPDSLVQSFRKIEGFFIEIEKVAKNCEDPSKTDRQVVVSLLAVSASALEAMMHFPKEVRAAMRPGDEPHFSDRS
jgi:hypothetical protein